MAKADSHHDSFNEEFCLYLEKYLGLIFENSDDEIIRTFWCDGVSRAPFHNTRSNEWYLSNKRVRRDRSIETVVYTGKTGQEIFNLVIELGPVAIRLYENGQGLKESLPGVEERDRIEIDIKSKAIKLRLE